MALLFFVFGAVVGSFLNVVILRYLSGENIVSDRSRCPRCRQVLRWWELIPLLSFAMLGGKCARCHKKISVQYPIVEAATAVAFMLAVSGQPRSWLLLAPALTIICVLIVLFVIDLYEKILPNIFLFVLTGAVLARLAQTRSFQISGLLLGVGFLGLLWLGTKVIYGRPGIGEGDVLLMIPLGLLFSWQATAVLLFLAFIVGGLVGLALLATKKVSMKTAIPFGPFLCGAAILLLLFPRIPAFFSDYFFGSFF